MDALWALKFELETVLEHVQAYRDDLGQQLITASFDDPRVIEGQIRDLYFTVSKTEKRFRDWKRDCIEAYALIRKVES